MTRPSIPIHDCRRAYDALCQQHDTAIARVTRSGWYLMGDENRTFEAALAQFCGVEHAIGVASGTDALELALRAVNCGPGCEVVTSPNAGMYASTAIVQTGAVPVFADVREDSLLISAESVSRMISDRTVAVIATHLFGRLCDISSLRNAIGRDSIALIEDCAQAHGARNASQVAGSFGDLAAFSFYPTKNLGGMGDGGAITTNRSELNTAVRELAQYGWSSRYEATRAGGRNSRLDEIQAAVLNVRLPYLNDWNNRRRDIVTRYRAAGRNTSLRFVSAPGRNDVCHLCVVRHADRDRIRSRFENTGIATDIHYPFLDSEQLALKTITWNSDDLTVARGARDEILTLPCFPHMRDDEIEHVCQTIESIDESLPR